MREIDNCGSRIISINDADFFGTAERPKEVMRALKGRGIQWQAGVTSKLAQDDRMLELAAASGCTLLSIGFESITRSTLTSVHKHVNQPGTFAALVEKVHSYGIMVFGLFMFGFDGDDPTVFDETAQFNIGADYDACAYSVLTPYPGTLTWYEMKKANRIVSFDWTKYDQANVVYRPAQMTGDQLRLGQTAAYEKFYSVPSMAKRFPVLRRAQANAVDDLQPVHEEGRGNRSEGRGRGADAGAGCDPDAADLAAEAGVAGGGAGGDGGRADAVGPIVAYAAPTSTNSPSELGVGTGSPSCLKLSM